MENNRPNNGEISQAAKNAYLSWQSHTKGSSNSPITTDVKEMEDLARKVAPFQEDPETLERISAKVSEAIDMFSPKRTDRINFYTSLMYQAQRKGILSKDSQDAVIDFFIDIENSKLLTPDRIFETTQKAYASWKKEASKVSPTTSVMTKEMEPLGRTLAAAQKDPDTLSHTVAAISMQSWESGDSEEEQMRFHRSALYSATTFGFNMAKHRDHFIATNSGFYTWKNKEENKKKPASAQALGEFMESHFIHLLMNEKRGNMRQARERRRAAKTTQEASVGNKKPEGPGLS